MMKTARPPSIEDRPCDRCGEPMIGIMRVSGKKAPRTICSDCEFWPGEGRGVKRKDAKN